MKPSKRFNQIKEFHLSNGTLFADGEFPAAGTSIDLKDPEEWGNEKGVTWMRPKELFAKPAMFIGGAESGDVVAGECGSSKVAAALSSLPEDEESFAKVCPQNQGFKKGYCGAFRFNFWQFGQWVEVIIDDRLPVRDGKLLFCRSNDEGEMWPALVEKAYAKLFNGYMSFKKARLGEVLIDLTGGTLETIKLKNTPKQLHKRIGKSIDSGKLLSCIVKPDGENKDENVQGLVKGRVYSVTGTATVGDGESGIPLVKLRNPMHDKLEWTGAWSDDSPLWESAPEGTKEKLGTQTAKDDGEFWMSYEDFCAQFTRLAICHTKVPAKNKTEFDGSWVAGLSAGGKEDPEGLNPQYRIVIKDVNSDGKCRITVSLMLKTSKAFKNNHIAIGYKIYPINDEAANYMEFGFKLSAQYFKDFKPIFTSAGGKHQKMREVCASTKIPGGEYVIVPSTEKPDINADFYLRVVMKYPANHKHNVELKMPLRMKGGRVKQMSNYANEDNEELLKLKKKFDKVAGEDCVISVQELWALIKVMSKDISSEEAEVEHSFALMALFDVDGSGHLDFQEFLNLNRFFKKCVNIFTKNCADKTSKDMTSLELEKALFALKISIPRKILGMAVTRYGDEKKRTVSFMDFLLIVCKFKVIMGASQEDPSGEKLVMAALIM